MAARRLPPLSLSQPAADERIAYGPGRHQFADLRLPRGGGPHPCVVVIHGGYWRKKYNLGYLGHFCAALTAAGVATWSIEYRRVGNPGGGWPGTFLDVAAAARHLVRIAPERAIDPARVIVAGHSAGGHLALWLAGLGRVPVGSAIAGEPVPLRGAVSLAGVVDLHEAWRRGLSDGAAAELLGGSPEEMPERYAAASPRALLPLGLPQVLVHGTEDAAVPYELSASYVDAARLAGDPATLISLPRADHSDVVEPAAADWPDILAAILGLAGA